MTKAKNLPRQDKRPVPVRFPMKARDEVWSLDWTIAHFVLPRLRYFRDTAYGQTPAAFNTNKQWLATLDKMIVAFELTAKGGWNLSLSETKKVCAGMDLFAKHFLSLWN